jgi:hypothetical protein
VERPEKSGESEMKMMKMDGMQSQIEINKVTRIMNQINLMERMKEMYVRLMGIKKYEQKVVALINKMPDMADAPVDLLMRTMLATIINITRITRQPDSVITNWISTPNSNSTPLHEVKQKVVKTEVKP